MDTIDKVDKTILFKKGAEASLFLSDWNGHKVIIKKRIAKRYRPIMLDEQIRSYRTVHEPQLMHEAKLAGVVTPVIYMVNLSDSAIVMEYIEGEQIKKVLNRLNEKKRHKLCLRIGESIAKMHNHSLIHGDLTTSNMIQGNDGRIYFIDFGLGEKNIEIEAKGVDLHLLKRALQSTHFQYWEDCLQSIFCGYTSIVGSDVAENVYEKIREIEKRGRYVEERKK